MKNMYTLMGHLKPATMAGDGAPRLGGEIACGVRLNGPSAIQVWDVRLGVRFSAAHRPANMADAMVYAATRFKSAFESWMREQSYTPAAYDTFVHRLLDELNEGFGPRFEVVFEEVVVYGNDPTGEGLAMLLGSMGIWNGMVPAYAARVHD